MRRQQETREYWEELVEEFEISGTQQKVFAEEKEIHLRTFQGWLYKIRRERDKEKKKVQVPQKASQFVEVKPKVESVEVHTDLRNTPALRVKLGALVVEFPRLPDPGYLVALAEMMRGGQAC